MNQQDREILRQRIIGYLATRFPLAFDASAICRSIKARSLVDFEITDADVTAALELLHGLGFTEIQTHELGASKYWKATSCGVLESERNGWEL